MACPKLKTTSAALATVPGDALVLPLYVVPASGGGKLPEQVVALDLVLGKAIAAAVRHKDWTGKAGEAFVISRPAGVKAPRVILYGLGEPQAGDADALRKSGYVLASALIAAGVQRPVIATGGLTASEFDIDLAASYVAEGFALRQYDFAGYKRDRAKTESKLAREATLAFPDAKSLRQIKASLARVAILVDAVHDARDLGNTPANYMTPSDLAKYARRVAKETGSKCTVLGVPEMKKLGMGGILGVSQGSAEPPRTIILEHSPRGAKKTLVFVGKGVTFDSGGISIKPWKPMWDMKFDMCGAAAVLGTFRALARSHSKHKVVVIVGATENLPDGKAYKPGDVVIAANGKSIEIHSTDAEGRVVLADMLHYAARYKPDAVVDLATLTGAVVTALGHHCAGVMGTCDELAAKLVAAGKRSGDRVWQLPLWDEYGKSLESAVADVCNTGDGSGGSIQGGWFLKQFTSYDWCHIDIAGTAWLDGEQPPFPKGGTGFGVRLLVDFAESYGDGPQLSS